MSLAMSQVRFRRVGNRLDRSQSRWSLFLCTTVLVVVLAFLLSATTFGQGGTVGPAQLQFNRAQLDDVHGSQILKAMPRNQGCGVTTMLWERHLDDDDGEEDDGGEE